MKKIISYLLALVFLFGCFSCCLTGVSAASGNAVMFNGFNSAFDYEKTGFIDLAGSSTKTLDTTTKFEGVSSLKIDMATTNPNFIFPYGYYFDIDGNYFDITKYDYVEVMHKSNANYTGTYQFQIHLIDTAISTGGSGYDFNKSVELTNTWTRHRQELNNPYNILTGMGNNINRIRFILLNYNGSYNELDMNIDGLALVDQEYIDARETAEENVANMISLLPEITMTNYASLANTFAQIEEALAIGNQNFVNFMPSNYATYSHKKALYEKYVTGVAMEFNMTNYFSDNVVFQQNKPIDFFGNSTTGRIITVEMFEGASTTACAVASETVGPMGEWTVSLPAMKGSYNTYRVVVKENGVVKRQMNNILIGELWLAAGQSNMEYRLDWEINGAEEMANTRDPYLRVLLMTIDPVGMGNGPAVEPPRYDIQGAYWTDASNGANIASMSANGYYAAKVMREKLNVPVAIINAALGSTNIQTWLSRESIDENAFVKNCLEINGLYKTAGQAAATPGDFRDMCAMYNAKIAPIEGLNIGGIFWCQGESNVDGKPNELGFYKQAIQTLASGYSKVFGFENGDIPLIVINIANQPYQHDAQIIPKWIEEISDAAAEKRNIINIPIYDVGYTYSNPPDPSIAFPIHPNTKKPGGTRAGLAAAHNFCGYGEANYYSPTVKSFEKKDGAIYVTFDGVADGLTTLNNSIGVHGFTISEKDGMFIPAKAEIVSTNVVKVWHEDINNPQNFTYAFNSHSISANLCNSYLVPAVPFRSNRNMTGYFCSNDWMYCESTTVYINEGLVGYDRPTWQGGVASPTLANVAVDNNVRYEGTGSIRVSYNTSTPTTAGATLFYGYYLMPFPAQTFKTISVAIKNPDARDKNFSILLGTQTEVELWKLPLSDTNSVKTYTATAKANSDFTVYTFALEDLVGLNTNATAPLANLNRMELMFEDSANGTVYIDGFSVGLLSAEDKIDKDAVAAQTVIDAINTLPTTVTVDDADVIAEVRSTYNYLTDAQKAYVTNLSKLEEAEAKLDVAFAKDVENRIAALPEKVTSDYADEISAIRSAYNALTDAQKAYVTNLAKLEDAEYQIAHPYVLGDVDGSGDITVNDALLTLQHSVGKITLTGNDLLAADVDGNGKVDVNDALYILQYSVEKISSFPQNKI